MKRHPKSLVLMLGLTAFCLFGAIYMLLEKEYLLVLGAFLIFGIGLAVWLREERGVRMNAQASRAQVRYLLERESFLKEGLEEYGFTPSRIFSQMGYHTLGEKACHFIIDEKDRQFGLYLGGDFYIIPLRELWSVQWHSIAVDEKKPSVGAVVGAVLLNMALTNVAHTTVYPENSGNQMTYMEFKTVCDETFLMPLSAAPIPNNFDGNNLALAIEEAIQEVKGHPASQNLRLSRRLE